ncbi:MAG TPA: chemotaxis protein CheB, partial [Thermoanaerobaculia bacterium]|nr:chemotaxis protein CheB [Thermoanaerobaculia bacterium]
MSRDPTPDRSARLPELAGDGVPGRAAASPTAAVRVVGIGASAGGLDAFMDLVSAIPPDTGLALVLVQHLDPRHDSLLA